MKTKIQAQNAELAVERQKLIHSGKVLKDSQTVGEIGVSEADFLVCMVTAAAKAKPTAAAPVAAPAAPSPVPATPPAQVAAAPSTPVAPTPAPAPAQPQSFVSAEGLAALTAMGFPEAESRAALQAAMGNPDLAYEFLLTGIPEQAFRQPAAAPPALAAPPASASGIQQLRQHPQFNMLKQLIQSNPASLPQVLGLIGQQNPALLAAIHANEQEFLAMMNEPIGAPAPAPVVPPPMPASPGLGGGVPNPAQMMQMLSSLPPAQRAQFAQSLGLSPEQLNMFVQMMATMPPDQIQQMLGGAGLGRAPPPGSITLTHEEMEAVNRLTALGFTQAQAAQAYLACDKNEALAANFLFENGFDDGDEGDFEGGDDDMYH